MTRHSRTCYEALQGPQSALIPLGLEIAKSRPDLVLAAPDWVLFSYLESQGVGPKMEV